MIEMKKQMIETFAAAISAANQAAIEADGYRKPYSGHSYNQHIFVDGGTCNFDTPVVNFSGMTQKDVDEVSRISGVRIGDKMSGFFKGYRFVSVELVGQANNRTRMAKAAQETMSAMGIDSMMYYQCD